LAKNGRETIHHRHGEGIGMQKWLDVLRGNLDTVDAYQANKFVSLVSSKPHEP